MTATQTKNMQLWPSGKSIQVRGDGEKVQIRQYDYNGGKHSRWKKATAEERKAIRIEELAEMYRDRDILCCDSMMVSEMIRHAWDLPKELRDEWTMESDNVSNLRADPSDWTLEQCKEWLEDKGHDLPDPNPWNMTREEMVSYIHPDWEGESETLAGYDDERILADVIREANDDDEYTDAWRDAVRENAEDEEIYEWWRVSNWLGDNLKAIGECVLDNAYGVWWGRGCTGQGMIMDGTLQRIAAKFA